MRRKDLFDKIKQKFLSRWGKREKKKFEEGIKRKKRKVPSQKGTEKKRERKGSF